MDPAPQRQGSFILRVDRCHGLDHTLCPIERGLGGSASVETTRIVHHNESSVIRGQGRIDSDGLLAGGDYRLHQHAISTHQGRSVLEMMLSASSQSNRPLCWTLPVRPNLSSQCCRPSWPSGNGQSVVGDAVLERAANEDVWPEVNEIRARQHQSGLNKYCSRSPLRAR